MSVIRKNGSHDYPVRLFLELLSYLVYLSLAPTKPYTDDLDILLFSHYSRVMLIDRNNIATRLLFVYKVQYFDRTHWE